MNEDLLYLIGLVLGDESGDGHDKTYQYSIYSNLDDEQLREAFKSGCNKVDVEFSDIVAEEYEECMLKSDILEKLQIFQSLKWLGVLLSFQLPENLHFS